MKIKEISDKLTENWPVKAACILLASIFYVFYVLSIQDNRSFTVPLAVEAQNGITVAGSYPRKVKVTLRGKTEDIASIRESDVTAALDLNYLSKAGTYKVPVIINLPKSALLLDTLEVRVSPPAVSLTVEEQISGFTTVKPLISGKPAYGYEIKKITVVPDQIEIRGPKSMVENCTRIQTHPVSVKNASESLSNTVSAENFGSFLKPVYGDKVTVTVEIVPVVKDQTFEKFPVEFINLNPDFNILPQFSTVSLNLQGNLLDLEKYNPDKSTVTVNCFSIREPGIYQLPVEYKFPAGISFSKEPLSVITLEVKRLESPEQINNVLETNSSSLNQQDEDKKESSEHL